MIPWRRLGLYAGGTISLGGLAFAAAFIGRRTADPIAAQFITPFTIWTKLGGIAAGLLVLLFGLAIIGLAGRLTDGE
ncbi:hypothetical protein [Haloplanus halobius]|uniref:hypothetical protein n=1 Tax=Haloplanus halobius TaxID=2934938 RepID=UPI00200F6C89|nr:hypothetical protein [Haloplanus sp. XH21]